MGQKRIGEFTFAVWWDSWTLPRVMMLPDMIVFLLGPFRLCWHSAPEDRR